MYTFFKFEVEEFYESPPDENFSHIPVLGTSITGLNNDQHYYFKLKDHVFQKDEGMLVMPEYLSCHIDVVFEEHQYAYLAVDDRNNNEVVIVEPDLFEALEVEDVEEVILNGFMTGTYMKYVEDDVNDVLESTFMYIQKHDSELPLLPSVYTERDVDLFSLETSNSETFEVLKEPLIHYINDHTFFMFSASDIEERMVRVLSYDPVFGLHQVAHLTFDECYDSPEIDKTDIDSMFRKTYALDEAVGLNELEL